MLISNSVKDGIIDHNEFLEILKEKKQYECLKNEENRSCLIISFFI